MSLTLEDTTPIYLQIANDIRHQILLGTLAEGDQVMSTTEYATTYRINPATAQKAFAELTAQGVLEKHRGIGTFVAPGSRERLREVGRQSYFSQTLDPALEQGRALGLAPAEILDHVHSRLDRDTTSTKGVSA